MAYVAPSSLADATLRPLLIAFCVVVSCDCVLLRYCSAVSAPVFVLTLKDIVVSIPFWWVPAFCSAVARWPRAPLRKRRARIRRRVNPLSDCFYYHIYQAGAARV